MPEKEFSNLVDFDEFKKKRKGKESNPEKLRKLYGLPKEASAEELYQAMTKNLDLPDSE